MREIRNALMTKLDNEYSRYIRLRDHCTCYTCGKTQAFEYMQAGHYIRRKHLLYRWDDTNVHCQCYYCNCKLHGNMRVYRKKMAEQYGEIAVQLMEARRFETVLLDPEWYHTQIDRYREINRRLENG